jgi:hypothetical protein
MMKCSEKGRGRGVSMVDRGREMRGKRERNSEDEEKAERQRGNYSIRQAGR